MDTADRSLAIGNTVVALDEKVAAFSCPTGRHLRRIQAAEPGERHAECFVLDALRQPLDVGLQNMRGWRALDGNGDLAVLTDIDRQLVLHACQRHRYALLANQKRAFWQRVQNTLERGFVGQDAEMISVSARLSDGKGSGSVPPEALEQTDNVLRRIFNC